MQQCQRSDTQLRTALGLPEESYEKLADPNTEPNETVHTIKKQQFEDDDIVSYLI